MDQQDRFAPGGLKTRLEDVQRDAVHIMNQS